MRISNGYNVWGMAGGVRSGYIVGMRVSRARVYLYAAPLLMGLSAGASVSSLAKGTATSQKIVDADFVDDAAAMRASLRRDVETHPAGFVVFATKTGAERFFAEHEEDADRETNGRLVSRGVVGYWQGKTLVILPLGFLKGSR